MTNAEKNEKNRGINRGFRKTSHRLQKWAQVQHCEVLNKRAGISRQIGRNFWKHSLVSQADIRFFFLEKNVKSRNVDPF